MRYFIETLCSQLKANPPSFGDGDSVLSMIYECYSQSNSFDNDQIRDAFSSLYTEVIKPSKLQQDVIKSLADRAEAIRGGGVDPSVDNMLRITNDGRKLALDMRLIQPLAPDDENGKVAVCARNVYRIWEETEGNRSTQMVFCDLSTPTKTIHAEVKDGVAVMDAFQNVYDDLKKKLMAMGIPAEEIAYIHDANSEVKKKELFAKVRSGKVRILMGSTQKMGAGTNCQDRLIALHDLDCPWRPSDLAQRLGRIVRQGNQNPEVEIFRYVTEGTFDAYLYQLVENKQKFIAQIMTSKTPVRVADDVDETALSYSEIKALATGNPLIIEKCNLDMEVSKLNMLKANHMNQRFALENLVLREYPKTIASLKEWIAGYEEDSSTAAKHPKPTEGFVGMEVLGKSYCEKEPAGKAIITACTTITSGETVELGRYRGFQMLLNYEQGHSEYRLTMKGTLSHTIVRDIPLKPLNHPKTRRHFMRKRNVRIQVWLSKKEAETFAKKVKRSGLSSSAYLRHLINGVIPRDAPSPDYYMMMREFHAIGNNLNQIAQKAHTLNVIDVQRYGIGRTKASAQPAFRSSGRQWFRQEPVLCPHQSTSGQYLILCSGLQRGAAADGGLVSGKGHGIQHQGTGSSEYRKEPLL